MSKEQAIDFVKKLSTSDKIKESLRAAMVKVGKDAGYKFSTADLEQALAELKAQEIPESLLSGVAAGAQGESVLHEAAHIAQQR